MDLFIYRIKEWKTELETVWNGKNTDAAEVERRNLRNLGGTITQIGIFFWYV